MLQEAKRPEPRRGEEPRRACLRGCTGSPPPRGAAHDGTRSRRSAVRPSTGRRHGGGREDGSSVNAPQPQRPPPPGSAVRSTRDGDGQGRSQKQAGDFGDEGRPPSRRRRSVRQLRTWAKMVADMRIGACGTRAYTREHYRLSRPTPLPVGPSATCCAVERGRCAGRGGPEGGSGRVGGGPGRWVSPRHGPTSPGTALAVPGRGAKAGTAGQGEHSPPLPPRALTGGARTLPRAPAPTRLCPSAGMWPRGPAGTRHRLTEPWIAGSCQGHADASGSATPCPACPCVGRTAPHPACL